MPASYVMRHLNFHSQYFGTFLLDAHLYIYNACFLRCQKSIFFLSHDAKIDVVVLIANVIYSNTHVNERIIYTKNEQQILLLPVAVFPCNMLNLIK